MAQAKYLEKTQWFSRERLAELQFERLSGHLEFAYQHVAYYRRLFDENGIQPKRMHSLDDFRRIPYLTREALRGEFEKLRAKIPIRGVQKLSTGGSSGQPVAILTDPHRNAFIDAARIRAQRWYDAEIGAKEVVLWGSPIEITRQDYVRKIRDRLLNSRLLSAFNLGERDLAAYVDEITRFKPQKMYGYASALYVLAQHFKKAKRIPPTSLKVVFATAEPLFDFQRRTIEQVFGAKVAVEYGARDAGLIANECPEGGLHIPAEGMFVEIEGGSGSAGEVVVTNLDSRAMPLVRYRTGDVSELSTQHCPCGRGLPLLKSVEGRQTDFIVTPDGRLIHALAVIYVLREVPEVEQFQVMQQTLTETIVAIVTKPEVRSALEQTLTPKLRRVLGSEMDIQIVFVPEISRSGSGKFRYVVSNVAQSYFERALEASSY